MLLIMFLVVVVLIYVVKVLNVCVGNIVLVLMLGWFCLGFLVSCSNGEMVIIVVGFLLLYCSCCVSVSVR